MGWFDEQIRQRKRQDEALFEDSFHTLSDAVLGRRTGSSDETLQTRNAIAEILDYYHIRSTEVPAEITDPEEQLEYVLRPRGVMRRGVKLGKDWYKDSVGALLGFFKDGGAVALLPAPVSGYTFYDPVSGKRRRVDRSTRDRFEEDAIIFYKPFPSGKAGVSGLLRFMADTLTGADIAAFTLAALAVSLVGLLIPKLNGFLFSNVAVGKDHALLLSATVFLACATLSVLLLTAVRELLLSRINTKLTVTVHAAVMARALSLPAAFFKNYSAGELASRAQGVGNLCRTLATTVLSAAVTTLFSLLYLLQIAALTPALTVPAALSIAASTAVTLIIAFGQTRVNERLMEQKSKEDGLTYALISGVQKIRLAGAEKRAYAKWSAQFAKEAALSYHPPLLLRLGEVLSVAVSLVTEVVLYFTAVRGNVAVADYYAFNTAYGMVSGAFLSLTGVVSAAAQIRPVLQMARPILETEPEISEERPVVTRLSGGVELNGVSFRYREDMPYVLDDLSLKIRPGQYVAIVGKSGCGKSTLLRLLLGFETPEKGAIYYDGRDLSTLDLRSLRRKIGTVLQTGRLFAGDVYTNIAITAPGLTMEKAWEAAEVAGIAEDIRRLPMGMRTVISEGSGGISGGQRQRLLIARAIASEPKILMFDEATSALDNLTQKKVSDALDKLHCTRIVIAHRLSTIRHCDRIIVLEGGKIVEDGNYEELMARGGFFAELVSRQQIHSGAEA